MKTVIITLLALCLLAGIASAFVEIPPCSIVLVGAGTFTCTHNLNTFNVQVWVWDSTGYIVRPVVRRATVNTVDVTFDNAFVGIAVIK